MEAGHAKLRRPDANSADNDAGHLTMTAMGLVGTRYRFGGNNPATGLDCSGLVRYVFKEAWGASVPRTSIELSQMGEEVSLEKLVPGDLVFYNTRRRSFSHVGIYLGGNKFIHAPSSGGRVRIDSMDGEYWRARFNGARRINGAKIIRASSIVNSDGDETAAEKTSAAPKLVKDSKRRRVMRTYRTKKSSR